jgi:predicted AAA+ superfamily ATPase
MTIFDISQLSDQNPWWIEKSLIISDQKLIDLNNIKYKWNPNIRFFINLNQDVIYTIRGSRQVGKTTLIKIIIDDLLLNKNIDPENVCYWSLERNTKEELHEILQTYLDWRRNKTKERKYIFLDEICSIKDWPRELIYFANKGDFKNCSIIITGSHSMDLKHSTELMPGRRGGGENEPIDKILLPMKFSEFAYMINPKLKNTFLQFGLLRNIEKQQIIFDFFKGDMNPVLDDMSVYKKDLDNLLEIYLTTGGFPSTINEFSENDKITTKLFNVYLTAIIGDLHRYRFKEHFFKQIVKEIFSTLSTPISWNSITKNTEIKSHNTVQDYITAFEELYIANISYRISIHDHRLKRDWKKVHVLDPFIFHALHGWAYGKKDYFSNTKANLLNTEMKSKLVESVVYNHLCRFAYNLNPRDLFDPKDNLCYYKDNKGKEIDFVILENDKYFPFEVKYQASIANSDFIPFKSFGKGLMISKNNLGMYRNYVKIPISLFLMLI